MAAPEFTLFVKPYLEGWDNGEEGNTPITAEILNDNYDAFLLALNEWATSVGLILEEAVTDSNYVHTDNNYTTTEKNKLSGIEANANNYSLPTASASTLGGVKIDGVTITIADGVISAVGGGGTDVEGNPSGTPTAVLSSIRIGQNIYSIPGGGSGGSSVSYSQILATGTKIGTITIDGVPTDIYAPTAPTNTSDLNNDSNFVADASYVHTDNNYTTTEKNKLADLNQVEANPSSGTSAGDLTSISVGGTKYNIPSGGGGGTTVVANPSGEATDELNKLQVGNTIYSIPEGDVKHLLNDILTGEDNTKVTASSSDAVEVAPWKAFDGINGVSSGTYASPYHAWLPSNGDAPCWLQYHFSTTKYIDEVKVYVYCNNSTYTGSAKIQGSNDGTSWTDISSVVSITAPSGVEIELNFVCNGNNYAYVRLYSENAFTVYGGASIFIGEMEIYGRDNASGGTTVIANPSGAATDELNKLQVGNTIYSIPEGSGSGHKDLTATLTAGSTSVTFTDAAITATCLIDPYTDSFGINPKSILTSVGAVTLIFDEQSTDVGVCIRISELSSSGGNS